jgi:GGDEF domain-containing protein
MDVTLGLAAFVSAARGGSRRAAPGRGERRSAETAGSSISHALRRAPAADRRALAAAADALRRARGTTIALLVMQIADIVELELVFGREAVDAAVDEVFAQLTRAAAGRGRVVRTEPDTFVLLVPDVGIDQLVTNVQTGLGRSRCIEFEHEGDEIILVPDVMGSIVAPGQPVPAAYEAVCGDLVRMRGLELQRRDYLRRERESHTRPAPLPARRA